MIPYGQQQINEDDIQAVQEVLRSDLITQGPTIDAFERKLEEYFEVDHALVVNNGTSALYLAYRSLGVESGDTVVTSPNTFVATANMVVENDGTPEFSDIDPSTFNLDPSRLETRLEQSKQSVRGLAPVHFAGLPCDMEELKAIADEQDCFLLEDACHAPGAEWRDSNGNWHIVGSCEYSDAAVMSFHPVKHITTGEGGAILTNRDDLADRISRLRTHGIVKSEDSRNEDDGPWYYEMKDLGINARITDFQCALGISQLNRLDVFLEKRRTRAERYRNAFEDLPEVRVQSNPDDVKHAYHLFVIRARNRDDLFDHLTSNGVSPQVHYIPVTAQPYYQDRFNFEDGDYPEAENYYDEALSIPLFSDLTEDQQEQVISLIRDFYS